MIWNDAAQGGEAVFMFRLNDFNWADRGHVVYNAILGSISLPPA